MYGTNWLHQIMEFDAKFGNHQVTERYQLLEQRLQQHDPVFLASSFSPILNYLTEAMSDAQQFGGIIPRITAEGAVKNQYAASVAEYTATQGIAVRIKDSLLPAYIAKLWESQTSSEIFRPEDKEILLHIVQFYEDCKRAFGETESLPEIPHETNADMKQWHAHYQNAALFDERADALREQYRTTFFSTKEALLTFVKETVLPLQRQNDDAVKGAERTKKYYPRAEGICALSFEIKEEIKHFAYLQEQCTVIQEKTNGMNTIIASLETVVIDHLSLQELSSLLFSCNQDYAPTYPLTPACPKFAPLEEAYSVASTTFTLKRDSWLSENKEGINTFVASYAAKKETLHEDRIRVKEIAGIVQEIETRTGILFGSEISDTVTALETKENSPVEKKEKHPVSDSYVQVSAPTSVQYPDYHPLWVAQQLEAFPEQNIPAHYQSLHSALVSGAKTAVVRAYASFQDGTLFHALGYGNTHSIDEKRYLTAVKTLFKKSKYVQAAL